LLKHLNRVASKQRLEQTNVEAFILSFTPIRHSSFALRLVGIFWKDAGQNLDEDCYLRNSYLATEGGGTLWGERNKWGILKGFNN